MGNIQIIMWMNKSDGNNSVIIYYCIWDGKNGSHDLLKRAAAHWCSCHNFMTEENSIEMQILFTEKVNGELHYIGYEEAGEKYGLQ